MPKRRTVANAQARPLSASECAQRTGLTIKALRIYERRGLIKPARSASGWRLYGHTELVRLNAIAALKALGLSLAQIRTALDAMPVELPRILRMQLDAWRARKEQAAKAIVLVQAALARVDTRQTLSVDNLCELARSIEMNSMYQWSRELMNENFTAEEERQWLNHAAGLSSSEMEARRQQFENWQAVLADFGRLMASGADPGSAEVQLLLDRSNALARESGAREQALQRLDWNPQIARKIHAVGGRLMARNATNGDSAAEERLANYIRAARIASKWGQALAQILEQAKALCSARESAAAPATQALARRFAQVCAEHGLGEPGVMARWLGEFGNMAPGSKSAPVEQTTKDAWLLLAAAGTSME